ncbi:GL14064 [Drosophila persimilis]|uniref:GL14064 n=1 Tax=Drosophila persimilis TaxID=7234 RepID=B4GNQ2_DROPE|nr:GL14064 [Drosophila persimilis]
MAVDPQLKATRALLCAIVLCWIASSRVADAQHLIAYISQRGLHGEITFRQMNATTVEIKASLEATLQYPDQVWSWSVRRFPVDYSIIDPEERCKLDRLGSQVLSFDEDLEYLVLPGNETSTWQRKMQLIGDCGIWGKSLVLTEVGEDARICATITTIQNSVEHMAEARFNTPVAGSVHFRWLAPAEGAGGDTLIYSDLYHIKEQPVGLEDSDKRSFTQHHWKIFVTDIFKHDHHRTEDNCNFLELVFDPQGSGPGQGIGDLDMRLGRIGVANNALKTPKRSVFRDAQLALLPSDLTIPHRTLYLVLFDNQHPDTYLACTKIRHVQPLIYKTFINSGGVKGEVTFAQRWKFDPTFLNFTLGAPLSQHVSRKFAEDVAAFRLHSMPPVPQRIGREDFCLTTGDMHNPRGLQKNVPPPGYGTQEQYAVGDLSGKLQGRNKAYWHQYVLPGTSSELSGLYWDVFLPLQGHHSIAQRSLVIYTFNRTDVQNITKNIWGCATLSQYLQNGVYQQPMFTAQVLFRYPVVGRVIFRQPTEQPWQDTTVLFEYLIQADGSTQNTTFDHRWAIHSSAPGKDFYDWQQRCLSAGGIHNPFKVYWGNRSADDFCKPQLPAMCRMGALDVRLGRLTIAGRRRAAQKLSRRMFVDGNLPLSGRHSILGKSLVIYEDNGPKARGERLACSAVIAHYRRKVVAKEWYANGDELTVSGRVEITQQSEYDVSNVEVQLKGLQDNGGYHIHKTPVEANLAFPCEASTLYGHWNPIEVNPKSSPPPRRGTSDQYELGDLSGKFGGLNGLTQYEDSYNDTNLPLFGYNSIIGRSVVIHKQQRNARWACSTLERGYSPSEARELRAIASFHHPTGYAYGYVKMTQLIHNDGSQSETVIEVKLRHPGKNDRNSTRNHNWQIFVNPVGVDAAVKPTSTRCVAGGYVWNPYYTQLADPLNLDLYEQECAPDNPLRCYVGDVGARMGTIDLGGERVVFTDSNFPLEAPVGAIGRSIVIFGPDHSHERFACANIEPDHNVIKYINLQKPPRFVVAQFLEELRSVMGIPEWMLDVDARKTKELHGGACIQMIIHFKGPLAHRLEMDMSRLIAAGRLDAPSLFIPGYVNQKRKPTISYRTCGVRDTNEKRE